MIRKRRARILNFIQVGFTFLFVCHFSQNTSAGTRTIRVVCYNIEADINGFTTPLPGLIAPPGGTVQQGGVLEGIGEELAGPDGGQPLDVLALQETTSNSITVSPIVNGLNAYYNSPGMYAMSPYQGKESGNNPSIGNGPNALVYNTKTLQLVASVPVDPPGTNKLGATSGEYREVVRYLLAPAGVTPGASNEFYVYVSHYKSGTTSTDLIDRSGEAVIIRNDEASNLSPDARVLYVGDFNVTTSSEASYQTMLAASAPNGIAQGQGVDPMNLAGTTGIDWGVNSLLSLKTESAGNLRYRDDFQVMTTNVYFGAAGGLAYVPGTYQVFGNNGTTPYHGTVNSNSNTFFNTNLAPGSPISAANLRLYLTNASDHLPVVADYTIPVPDPAPFAINSIVVTNGALTLSWQTTAGAVYRVDTSSNLSTWLPFATNLTANGTNFTFTTNTGVAAQFFRVYRAP